MATLTDVARRAGVVPSIVSRLLNDDPTLKVRPDTRERIMRAVKELAYSPNHAARTLRTNRTGVLALIIPDITNPIYSGIVHGAEAGAREADYLVLLGDADEFAEREALYRGLIGEARVDGVLLQRSTAMGDATLRGLAMSSLPTVLVNSRLLPPASSVIFDDQRAATLAVEHLAGLGHTKIGFLGGPRTSDVGRRRADGYVSAMVNCGLPVPPSWTVSAEYDDVAARTAVTGLLRRARRPSALVAANITAAIGVLAAAKDVGLSVPSDLSVVAIHDSWFASHTAPPLTTVRMPTFELGRTAIKLLLRRIAGEPPAQLVVSEPIPELIIRSSTAGVRVGRRLR